MSSRIEISKKLFAINSTSSVVTRLFNISVLIWLHQYLLRRISPDEYSLYPVVMAVMVFVTLLTTILTSGLSRYIVEAYAKGDEQRITQIVSTMFPLLLGAGVILLALGWTFAWYIDRILTIASGMLWDARIMMALLIFSAATKLTMTVYSLGLYVRQKFVLLNCILLCTSLLRIALLFVLLLGISTRVLWVVVATVSSELCSLFVTIMFSRALVSALKFQMSEIRWNTGKSLVSFGTWYFFASLAGAIRKSTDPLILNNFATGLDVTCFHLGSIPRNQLEQMSIAAGAPLQPVLTGMYGTGEKDRLRNTYLRGSRFALWMGLLIAFPMMVFSKELVSLYVGQQYMATSLVLVFLMATVPIVYSNHLMLSKIVVATAQIRQYAVFVIIIQLANVILTLYFVVKLQMGAVGSGLATFLVTMFEPLLLLPLALRIVAVSLRKWLQEVVYPAGLPGIMAMLVWVGLKLLVRPESWLMLGVCAGSGAVCYLVILLAFCLKPRDRQDISAAWNRILKRSCDLTDYSN